ncbi:hypothetical protein JOD54_006179 [Actinokineospora baliensis]|uniref:hypothetical protein n=1 Tax=Actinokineospora baliensis TaxID=547056 RepID=UPI00195CEE77|nr:hypothetical protein [Actinokineospora baliensis]MBM7775975.1 hypothetical protein [Actinokineospora baliensis]
MSKTMSTFVTSLCAIPVAFVLATGVQVTAGSTSLSDEEPKNPPTTTTTITTEGNPWHG